MKQTRGTTRTAWVMLFFLLSSYLGGVGIASVFTRNIQNIEIDAESEGEPREETEIHAISLSQPVSPRKGRLRAVKTIYSLPVFPKYNRVSQSTVLSSTRVITYCSFLL